jgi:hypothetical protein
MSRAVLTLQEISSSQEPIGGGDYPAGMVIMVSDTIADDLVTRGLCAEITTAGTGTILNGTATIAVVHGLAKVPTSIDLTGQHSEVSAMWATAPTSSGFVANVAVNVTADRKFYWSVR